ncbi:GNAT family N-acetyltransferase [Microbulbifer sp. 2205BS26-8]|uniref:GNAT family N-acetyltransferase n=1 Tax=Microbulbifer sp. 2205BS26-8 TaxID=3064386 RepID=UPI00273FE882|nr:GNAT family N-acetyltransferase [Microbulbifer sp. 2205BS26-8]MDP5210058.1 GNAT family N-acetyltransferase [Microbulbifer sp. 2205BS26-8]
MFQIQTPNLILLELCDDDASFILNLLNDTDFLQNIGDRGVRNLEQARTYIRDGPVTMYRQHNVGLYKVALKEGTAIGICGLIKRVGLSDVDLGFAFLPQYRGMGYALEAAQGVMQYAQKWLGLERIAAIILPSNTPSVRLLKKIGFRAEGRITLPGERKELLLMIWKISAHGHSPGEEK